MGNCLSCRHKCYLCERSRSECNCRNVGSCSCMPNATRSSSCVFYSPRIQDLYKGLRTEEETSRYHHSVVDYESYAEEERVGVENRKYFDEVLVKHKEWGAFFSKFEELELGEKIGEGGQAEIFALKRPEYLVAKVFNKIVALKDLERQWPPEVMREASKAEIYGFPFNNLVGGVYTRDGEYKDRFAFVMRRRWGDLRTLIDSRMLKLFKTNKHGPPFENQNDMGYLIRRACFDLRSLHSKGVVHRDVKASNLLVDGVEKYHFISPILMDFECSLGVVGTGFWRAPEILQQLQRGVLSQEVLFTKEADIYSFGMLCYEIVTGCIPFEGHPPNDYNIVLRGDRPKLPDDLDPLFKDLILACWQSDPHKRPSVEDIDKYIRRCVFFSPTFGRT